MSELSGGVLNAKRDRKAVLFTDLEGSTQWLRELGPLEVFPALERHFTILGDIFSEFSGRIIKRTGDGVMAVFDTIELAIRAAVKAQQELQNVRVKKGQPLLVPPIRVGISAGEAFFISGEDINDDYFGKVCAEASRILDLAHGNHILVAAEALAQEELSVHLLKKDDILPWSVIKVFRKGLDEVPVQEILYRPDSAYLTTKNLYIKTRTDGLIEPQAISRSRPDIAPFSYFESSDKASGVIDDFLKRSKKFCFLHVRGFSAGSSSPFNRFLTLMANGELKNVETVTIGILNPETNWLKKYYTEERTRSEEEAEIRINECKKAIDRAEQKLKQFSKENLIQQWKMFLYEYDPIWRLIITENGAVASPYGGPNRAVDNIVLFTESTEDSIYYSFLRYFNCLDDKSETYRSCDVHSAPLTAN